ncbi:MAG: Brp/Blh family beta-carotene 15,15'-dioxygenase [Pseudomonadota bacterium]|nr:Brp/Blh family beta-carotene 15,15'-dioxygenase [Pseudomonadota bacterium]
MTSNQKEISGNQTILKPDAFLFWMTSLFLCLQANSTPFRVPLETLITCIIIIGISHGATDFLILKKTMHNTFIQCLKYMGIVIIAILFWIAFPLAGLLLFLIISAHHFGCDWEKKELQILQSGIGLLCIPLYYHPNETLEILNLISDKHVNLSFLVTLSSPVFYLSILRASHRLLHKHWIYLEYMNLLILGKYLHPLTFFTLYFCTLHSMRHLNNHVLKHTISKKDIFAFIATSCASWGLLIVFSGLIIDDLKNIDSSDYLRPLFIFIFSITVPHMLLAIQTKKQHSNKKSPDH